MSDRMEYAGALKAKLDKPPKKDFDFRIVLGGEAMKSLGVIVFDLAALMWGVRGHGHHPGFLLHDSPREADLEEHVYQRLLTGIWQIASQLGGDQAPFQYIMTTTSPPPPELLDNDVTCLKLRADPEEELLFKQRLNSDLLEE